MYAFLHADDLFYTVKLTFVLLPSSYTNASKIIETLQNFNGRGSKILLRVVETRFSSSLLILLRLFSFNLV